MAEYKGRKSLYGSTEAANQQRKYDLQTQVKRFGSDIPRSSPCPSVSSGLQGLQAAILNSQVSSFAIVDRRIYNDNLYRKCLKEEPLISFTRHGRQEFAVDDKGKEQHNAWWDRSK